jgi:hypothetical protein
MADDYVPETKKYELLAAKMTNKGRHLQGTILELTDEEAERLHRVVKLVNTKKPAANVGPAADAVVAAAPPLPASMPPITVGKPPGQ